MSLINITPREYQQTIFQTAKDANTLVVLPTGLGKTLIALLLTIERQKAFPGQKALFLAPTRPLVEQHLNYFKKHLPELFASLEIFTGSVQAPKRKSLFERADIIFSTPQCISNDVQKALYSLHDVSLLIIDEAHRCLKNYAYTKVVNAYKNQSENQRILGLTASPGHEPQKIKEICKHLDIEEIELRSRESPDVSKYLQTLDFEKVEVPFPSEFLEIKTILKKLFDSNVEKLRQRNLLFGPANKITLLKLQGRLFPRIQQRDFNALHGVSLTAQSIKISHALELLETQTLSSFDKYLKSIKLQAQQKKSKAVQKLVAAPEFALTEQLLKNLLDKEMEHPKVEELSVIMENQFKENPKAKTIIFAQFRDTISLLAKKLNKIPEVKAKVFVGQAKKGSGSNSTGLNQKEQKAIIQDFHDGKINVLCATSIGEEGLDIPEVSSVIFYEPIPSAIRKIQRAGRTARLAPGSLKILITKDTRDVAHHYASAARERKMHSVLEDVKKDLKNPKTLNDFK